MGLAKGDLRKMSNNNGAWINEEEIDTVCLECFKVTKQRALLTCPICGGKTIYVRHGTAKRAIDEIKSRGHTDYGI